VEEFYTRASYVREDTEMSLEFGDDVISLSIPRNGMELESGWRIRPLSDPIIRKVNVDHFSGGRMIPSCVLLLQWLHPDIPHACLEHEINLIGARGCSFFTLYTPKAAIVPPPSPSDTKELYYRGIENLADIVVYLHPLSRTAVFNLGLVLGLDYNRLKSSIDSPHFLADMLAGWLHRLDLVHKAGVPTWRRLVEALRDPRVGQNGIACGIEQDECY